MDQELKKKLAADPDGLLTYEYIANNIGLCDDLMDELVNNMILVDSTGQFTVSAARYLHAINAQQYASAINRLVAAAIEKDREHRYLPILIESLYGADYEAHAADLAAADDNFRRIYKRLFPSSLSL